MSVTTENYKKLAESLISAATGSGSVSWSQPWQSLNNGTYSASQFDQLFDAAANSNTGFNKVLNSDGSVRAYTYIDSNLKMKSFTYEDVINSFDSNTQTGTNSVANTFTAKAVSDTVIDNNTVQTPANVTKYKNGSLLGKVPAFVGSVVSGIAAASTGINLGKAWSQACYDDGFNWLEWAGVSMETLDPSTWGTITQGDDSFGAKAFNFIFGIDGDTNKLQTYMDEDAFAYMSLLLKEYGAFSSGSGYEPLNSYTPKNAQWNLDRPSAFTFPIQFVSPLIISGNFNSETWYYIPNGGTATYIGGVSLNSRPSNFVTVSNTYFTYTLNRYDSNGQLIVTSTETPFTTTIDGNTYYFLFINLLALNNINVPTYNVGNFGSWTTSDVVKLFYNQPIPQESGGIDGVEDIPGSTPPNTSGWSTPQDTKTSLQNQYPDLWNNRIENEVLQPDGTTKTYTYIPSPFPADGLGNNPVTIDNTQGDNTIDPDNSSDTLLQTLINTLTQLLPQPMTDPETDTKDGSNEQNPDYNPKDGTGDGSSPTIIVPTGEASSLFKIYNPTQAQLDSFGSWLWSSNFVDQIKKLFNDPMQSIVGIHKVFAAPSTGGTTTIHVGYLDSGVTSDWVDEQYTYVNCGTVSLSEYFGNVFDYSPFTTVRIYLPFIGIVPLDVADVMRSSINVEYGVDVLTGKCLAMVKVTRDGNSGGVLYQYEGSCICRYPYSSGSYMGIVTSVLGAAMAVGLSGGAGMAVLGATTSIANNFRTNVQQGGSFTGESGAMGGKTPYLIISRPQPTIADQVERFLGWPANYTATLSNASGFVKVTSCHVETVANATDIEKREIENWLKTGVVIA